MTSISFAKEPYIIGFRGMGGAFDTDAFIEYANSRSLKPHVFDADQVSQAAALIKYKRRAPYQLYGYSLGAVSVRQLLTIVDDSGELTKPSLVITAGAFRSSNVNFIPFRVPFINFLDESGRGINAPYTVMTSVSHDKVMRFVTDFLENINQYNQ